MTREFKHPKRIRLGVIGCGPITLNAHADAIAKTGNAIPAEARGLPPWEVFYEFARLVCVGFADTFGPRRACVGEDRRPKVEARQRVTRFTESVPDSNASVDDRVPAGCAIAQGENHMRTLRMSWNTEEGRLMCHWVELEEGANTQADSSPPQWVAQTRRDLQKTQAALPAIPSLLRNWQSQMANEITEG